jgi:hypothetical protein
VVALKPARTSDEPLTCAKLGSPSTRSPRSAGALPSPRLPWLLFEARQITCHQRFEGEDQEDAKSPTFGAF